MTALTVLDVSASEKAALNDKRIAGGTAEGLPFVPIEGWKVFLFIENLLGG